VPTVPWTCITANLRAIDAQGKTIFDQVDYQKYVDLIAGGRARLVVHEIPLHQEAGAGIGLVTAVGPLARMNTADFIDTPRLKPPAKEFAESRRQTQQRHHGLPLGAHDRAAALDGEDQTLLHDTDLQGSDLVVKGQRREEGVGLIEAPRGTLFHHYRVDKNDQVVMANLIVSTTHNNEPMNRAVSKVAQDHLSGVEITEGLLNRIEVAIRAYDPCLSCATHALGRWRSR